MPQRIEQIKNWLKSTLQAEVKSLEPASSDASFRRYFRVCLENIKNNTLAEPLSQPSYIVMDAPPDKEDITPFVNIATYLQHLGVNVPHLYAVDESLGFILMSDLGSTPYLSLLSDDQSGQASTDQVDKLYCNALEALLIMQQGSKQDYPINLPLYEPSLLQMEMELLPNWYVKVHLESSFTVQQQSVFEQAMQKLIASAQEQPQVFVHRDYHSRNLMLLPQKKTGIIDFQDAVIGPLTYDLVSLLRDSYIAWPEARVYAWVEEYRQMLLQAAIIKQDDKVQFMRWFDWMGIQRQLKVVGIFARLNYRDGKSNYLNDIPLTLEYLLSITSKYIELKDLYQLLTQLAASE